MILVASSRNLLDADQGDLWDSGRITSSVCSCSYGGKPLASGERVYWKVRTSGRDGVESPWSPCATWLTGIMNPGDWDQASWITAPAATAGSGTNGNGDSLRFGRRIPLEKEVRSAVLHLSATGHYKLQINGDDHTPALLTPGWTDTEKTLLYDTIDLTGILKKGTNTALVTLGGGMYRIPKSERYAKFTTDSRPLQMIGILDIDYGDGSRERMVTDGSWQSVPSPVTFCTIYGGEDHDARVGLSPGDDTKGDPKAGIVSKETAPKGVFRGGSEAPPSVREIEILRPISTNTLADGSLVLDLGQNASIMPRIAVHGSAGGRVRITPSELLNDKGDLDDTMNRGRSFCVYTLKGGGVERWRPDFYYRGARYLKLQFIPPVPGAQPPELDAAEGVVVHADAPSAGWFACSDDRLNRIYLLVRWAQRSNMMSVLTDCPTREKLGWLEQDHLNGPALRYNFDLDTLFSKICRDMEDAQTPEGLVPDIAPEFKVFQAGFRDSPEWGSACILIPWQQYEFTGNTALLGRHYNAMKRYAGYLESKARGGIVNHGLGDWYDLGPKPPDQAQLTPHALTATAFFWQDVSILSKAASLLGNKEDAARYGKLSDDIKKAFNARFFDAASVNYSTGSQCANAIPLVMGLVPEESRPAVLGNLVRDIEATGLTAGDVGFRYVLRALADGGRSDVILSLISREDRPGYAMQLAKGATSLTEAWDAQRRSSQNHFMLGQVNEWFFHDVAGIQPNPESPGFGRIVIRPALVGDLTWAGADYESIRGKISSWWKRSGNEFSLNVTIPPGTSAKVFLPARNPESVREGDLPLAANGTVRVIERKSGEVVLEIPSGSYRLSSRL